MTCKDSSCHDDGPGMRRLEALRDELLDELAVTGDNDSARELLAGWDETTA